MKLSKGFKTIIGYYVGIITAKELNYALMVHRRRDTTHVINVLSKIRQQAGE